MDYQDYEGGYRWIGTALHDSNVIWRSGPFVQEHPGRLQEIASMLVHSIENEQVEFIESYVDVEQREQLVVAFTKDRLHYLQGDDALGVRVAVWPRKSLRTLELTSAPIIQNDFRVTQRSFEFDAKYESVDFSFPLQSNAIVTRPDEEYISLWKSLKADLV